MSACSFGILSHFRAIPVSFSHAQYTYILVLLLYKKLQFINRGGKSITKTYWNHFEMSLLTPSPHKKVHHIFIIAIFDSHTMYCDFCAWAICGSKKGDIQLEGTLTKYQSFRTVLKKVYHLLLTIFNWDQFRRWGFLQFDTHISNTNTAICFNKQWHFLCSNKINEKWLPTNMYHQYYFF